MHLLQLLLETCLTKTSKLEAVRFFCTDNFWFTHKTCRMCTVMKLDSQFHDVNIFRRVQTWGTCFIKSVNHFMSTPLPQVDKSFHFDNQGSHLIFLTISSCIDPSLLTSLTSPQLISLLFALLCELTRRLNIPIEVAATIGDAADSEEVEMPAEGTTGDFSTSNTAASSTEHPWRMPSPNTPDGPLPADQCLFICGIDGCDTLCAATDPHGYHRCEHHWWY